MIRWLTILLAGVVASGSACGSDASRSSAGSITSGPTRSPVAGTSGGPTLSEFAADADEVCRSHLPRFVSLKDPDGDGGQKPIGLGRAVEDLFTELGTIRPPAEHEAAWDNGIALLVESGRKLTEAEEVAAGGDVAASDRLQSEALFDLQPRAQELIDQIGAPFGACFTG